jgi:DNA-binding response OmpR family regulator
MRQMVGGMQRDRVRPPGDPTARDGAAPEGPPRPGATVAPGWLNPTVPARRPAPASRPEAGARADRSERPSDAAGPPARILVVDDEPTLRETLGYFLRREGFEVMAVDDGAAAVAAARTEQPDLIVLDIMLPSMDGYQVCRTLRAESTVPILLLSARGEEFDRVLGLELGADDYLAKPFALRELVARIRAMLRRAGMPTRAIGGSPAAPDNDAPVSAGDITIDPLRRLATRAGSPLVLKPKEFDLLLHFARQPTIVHTREALLRDVWGYDYPIDTRTVDVHIRWLRQKIEQDDAAPQRIETVRGHGYRFVFDGD